MKHPEVATGYDPKSFRCCFCCHVKTGTVIFGVFVALSQLAVLGLMILASISPDVLMPEVDRDPSEEVFNIHVSDGKLYETFVSHRLEITKEQMCIFLGFTLLALIFSVLMIYGVARNAASYLMPMFSIQVFDFCLSCFSLVSSFTYAPDIKVILHDRGLDQLPIFKHLACMDRDYLMLLFVTALVVAMSVKAYLIGMVWSCSKYIQYHVATRQVVREYHVDPYTQMLLPPRYEDAIKTPSAVPQPPAYAEE